MFIAELDGRLTYIEGMDKSGKNTLAEKLAQGMKDRPVVIKEKVLADCNPYFPQAMEAKRLAGSVDADVLSLLTLAAKFDHEHCLGGLCGQDCLKHRNVIVVSLMAARSYAYHSGHKTGCECQFRDAWDVLPKEKIDYPILLTVSPEARRLRMNDGKATENDRKMDADVETACLCEWALSNLLRESFGARLIEVDTSNINANEVFDLVNARIH